MTAQALAIPFAPIAPADLIADCGHPQWPWWQMVMLLAIAAQLAGALYLHADQLRPARPRPIPTRIVRVVRAGGRDGS